MKSVSRSSWPLSTSNALLLLADHNTLGFLPVGSSPYGAGPGCGPIDFRPVMENPFVMVESRIVPVPGTFKPAYLGSAAIQFNHEAVQGQFNKVTVNTIFKPLMAAVGVLKRDMERSMGAISDNDWLEFFSSCSARESSYIMNLISRLYLAAATGNISGIHEHILLLAEQGLATGSETKVTTPVLARKGTSESVDWNQLVGQMVVRIGHLMQQMYAPPAPIQALPTAANALPASN